MSYLLDALKKANGEEPVSSPSVQTAAPASHVPSSSNGYQWLSVVLAILLALTIGYLVGTKWSWVEQQIIVQPQAVPVVSSQPAVTTVPNETMTEKPQPSLPASSPIETQPNKAVNTTSLSNNSEIMGKSEGTIAAHDSLNDSHSVNAVLDQAEQATDALVLPEEKAATKTLVVTKNEGSDDIVVQEAEPLLQENEVMLGYVPEDMQKEDEQLGAMNLDDVSPQLLAHFRMAVEDSRTGDTDQDPVFETDVVAIHELGRSLQARIPAMSFTTHIYATDPSERWVKINGKTIKEGQWMSSSLQLIDINPQYIVMAIDGRKFTLAALTDWDGIE